MKNDPRSSADSWLFSPAALEVRMAVPLTWMLSASDRSNSGAGEPPLAAVSAPLWQESMKASFTSAGASSSKVRNSEKASRSRPISRFTPSAWPE